jgi:regulator of sigma E protease
MSWVLAFVGFAVLIILHELGHFTAAKAVGMRVERFSLFFPPLLLRKRFGNSETEYALGSIPFGGYVKISGMNPAEELPPEVEPRAYYRQPVWKRIVVIAAGPAVNIALAFLILFVLFVAVGQPTATNTVEDVRANSPAAAALQPGDEIVAIDGVRGDPATLREQINSHPCPGGRKVQGCEAATPVEVTVLRDGRERTVQVTPTYDAELGRMLLGFGFGSRNEPVSVPEAAGDSVTGMWNVTRLTVEAIAQIFDSEKRKEISGIVGGYETTRQSFEFNTVQALQILALISLSLGIVNLFPFLPLDGGHIFWALAEKVRGRPIPFSVMERSGVVGFVLIMFLFVIGLTNDIGRITGEGFNVR